MKKGMAVLFAVIIIAGTILVRTAAAGQAPLPSDYGKVILNNLSQKNGMAPVVFDHWLHRAKHSCRLCHVDAGFEMRAGATRITAADNQDGLYCGVCHNGKAQEAGRKVFAACSTDKSDLARCERCHSQGKAVKREYEFSSFTAAFPKQAGGNGINWEKAASDGLIKPIDYIEGLSLKRPAQPVQPDFTIHPKSGGTDDIIFSHKKHVVWNGCEGCHPEVFKGGKRGTTTYSMEEINKGKYCGVCHRAVAFPLTDCKRCHSAAGK